jgi:hypothetical protein
LFGATEMEDVSVDEIRVDFGKERVVDEGFEDAGIEDEGVEDAADEEEYGVGGSGPWGLVSGFMDEEPDARVVDDRVVVVVTMVVFPRL